MSRASLGLRVVGMAIPLGDRRRCLCRLFWGLDMMCEPIFSEEKRICQR